MRWYHLVITITLCLCLCLVALPIALLIGVNRLQILQSQPNYRLTNVRGIFRVTNGSSVIEVQHVMDRQSILTDQGGEYLQSYSGYRTTLSNGYSSEVIIANHYSNYAYQILATLPGHSATVAPKTWVKLMGSETNFLADMDVLDLPTVQELSDLRPELRPTIIQLIEFAGVSEINPQLITITSIDKSGDQPIVVKFSGIYAQTYKFDGEIGYTVTEAKTASRFQDGELIDKIAIDLTDKTYQN